MEFGRVDNNGGDEGSLEAESEEQYEMEILQDDVGDWEDDGG